MNARDRKAMRLAIEATRAEDEPRRRQVDAKLASEPWEHVGRFCVYHCQMNALNLAPWQRPPCLIEDPEAVLRGDDDAHGRHNAARLLLRMRKLYVSRYEPDPLRRCEEAEAKRNAAA
jgi:hypothetical protein